MGNDGVDPVGQGRCAQRPSPFDAGLYHFLNELIPGVGDEGLTITQIIGAFVFLAGPLQGGLLQAAESQSLLHQLVSLNKLDGGPVGGDVGGIGLVVDQLAHLVVDLVGEVVVQVVGLHRDAHMHLVVGHLQ